MKIVKPVLLALALGVSGTLSMAQDELRFVGSNTVGEKLAPTLINAFLQQKYPDAQVSEWIDQKEMVDVEGQLKEETWRYIEISSSDPEVPKRISVKPYGSGTSFKALDAGEADIGMSSRPIKSSEVVRLSAQGDMTAPEAEQVIALDGVAVIVHPDNPINALTMDQVAQIFACEIKDWSEVGGTPGPITMHARDANSGTWDTFNSVVLKERDKKLCADAKRYYNSQELSEEVQRDPGAIGAMGLAYIGGAKALDLTDCGLAYGPSSFAVKTEEYPIARRLFMYTPEGRKSPFSKAFIDFVQSEEGQAAALSADSVDLSIEDTASCSGKAVLLAETRSALMGAQDVGKVKDFVKATEGAQRLSVTFRYRTAAGGQVVDNRAVKDVDRLARFLKLPENQGRKLMLFGFADSVGSYTANCRLAQARADGIAKLLKDNGVQVALAKGVCEEAPVACDDPKEGNDKNRRVEAWLR